jgi:hypothetical protein
MLEERPISSLCHFKIDVTCDILLLNFDPMVILKVTSF